MGACVGLVCFDVCFCVGFGVGIGAVLVVGRGVISLFCLRSIDN